MYWAGPSRGSWFRFGQDLTKLVAQSAPDIFVVTYTEPGLGPVQFGHVVVQGRDLRVGPGQPLGSPFARFLRSHPPGVR